MNTSQVIKLRLIFRNPRFLVLFQSMLMCLVLFMPDEGLSSDQNSQKNSGPTLKMSYSDADSVQNPINSFMYFVPLIARTRVDSILSLNNEQQLKIISNHVIIDSKTFTLTCDFEVSGHGFHMDRFDSAGMIATKADAMKKRKSLKHMLDYIKISGSGFGVIEVKGTITGSTRTVNKVVIHFNGKGKKSPVTIGLYEIRPEDGQYKYDNRTHEVVARVNSLIFEKTEKTPHMGITIASITDKKESDGFFGRIKGAIVNLFITPPKVSDLGNTTMLEFGHALLQKKTEFTFPKADNINEIKPIEPDSI